MVDRIPTFQEFVAQKIREGWRPPMPDPLGGGGGVTANDILGQGRGPVVVGPPLAPPPTFTPPAFSETPQLNTGSPLMSQGGSSDSIFSVPSGGYGSLPVRPSVVTNAENAPPGSYELALAKLLSSSLVGQDRPTYVDRDLAPTEIPDPLPPNFTGQDRPTVAGFNSNTPVAGSIPTASAYDEYIKAGYSPEEATKMAAALEGADFSEPPEHSSFIDQIIPGASDILSSKPVDLILNKGREYIQGREADALYEYLLATPEERLSGRYRSEGMAINPTKTDFAFFDAMSPTDQEKFKAEYLDAYQHGYTPTKKVLTDIGTYADVPTQLPPSKEQAIAAGDLDPNATDVEYQNWAADWRLFEPGSKAAHEYLAGTRSFWQRGIADVVQDPTSYLGLERPVGEALVRTGIRLTGNETGSVAAKVIGTALKGAGHTVNAPNVMLNWVPDVLISETIGGIRSGVEQIPWIGRAVQQHKRGQAIQTSARTVDALLETGAADDLGGMAPRTDIGSVPEPTPGALRLTAGDEIALPGPGGRPHPDFDDGPAPEVTPPVGGRPEEPIAIPEPRVQPRPANWYEPYPDGGRLIDDIYHGENVDAVKLGEFDAVNEPKRATADELDLSLQREIDEFKQTAAASDYDTGTAIWDNEIRPRFIDQKLVGVDHVVNDVIPDYRLHIGDDIPEIPIGSKPKSLGREMGDGETLNDLVGQRTPAGNQVIYEPEKDRFLIKGSSSDTPAYVTRAQDGTYTVTYKKQKKGTALVDAEVVEMVDGLVKTAKASHPDENLGYLIERAVYRTDATADSAMNELRNRIDAVDAKKRISAQQYEDIATLKQQFLERTGQVKIAPNREQIAWQSAKERARAISTQPGDDPSALLIQKVARSDSTNLEGALIEVERRGRVMGLADAIIAEVKQFFRDMFDQNLYAVNPRLRRSMSFESQTMPGAPEAAVDTRPFQPSPTPMASDWAGDVLSQPWERGAYQGANARQVYAQVLPKVQSDAALYRNLKNAGADPDRLTKAEVKELAKKAKSDSQRIAVMVKREDSPPLFGQPPAKQVVRRANTIDYADLNPDQTVAWLEREYGRYGNLATTDPREMAAHMVGYERALSIDPGLSDQLPLALDFLHALIFRMPRTLLLADPITAWTYTMRNIMSNFTMSTMDRPEWVLHGDGWRSIRGAMRESTLDNSIAGEMMDGLTGGKIPQELRSTTDKMESVSKVSKGRSTPTSRFMDEHFGLGNIGRPFDWKRNVDRSVERGMKIGAGFAPALRNQVSISIDTLAREMEQYAGSRGMTFGEQEINDLLYSLRDKNGVFDRNAVYDALYYQAKDAGYIETAARNYAETASRRWQNLGKQAELDALKRTNYIFPSNLEGTNIDHYLSYVTLFHFWPTRSAKFVLEEMIRHPQYAMWWYKAHEGVARMAEEGGYPDSVKGLMRLYAGPFGYAFYANPAALFMVTFLLPDTSDTRDPKGVTVVGKWLLKLKKESGLGPIPALDAALNLMGIYGDSSLPDILPSRTSDLVLAGLDAALTAGGHPPHTPIWDQTMENARETMSGMIPWTNNVPAGDVTGYVHDQVASMILQQNPELWQRMVAVGPDGRPTEDAAKAQAEFDAILDDESSPQFVSAEQAVTRANLVTKGLNLFFPLSVRSKQISREESLQLSKGGHDKIAEAKKANPEITYDETQALLTPAEREQIATRAVVTESPEQRDLTTDRTAIGAYGTDRQVSLNDGYNIIAYKELKPGEQLIVGTKVYWYSDVVRMSVDERRKLADEWLISQNGLEEYGSYREGRDALIDSMPAYNDYDGWMDFMRYEGEGSVSANRDVLIENSPGYRTYIDALPDDVKNDPDKYETASLSDEAFLAASGKASSVYDQPPGDALDPSKVRYDQIAGGTAESTSSTSTGTDYETATKRLEKLNKAITKYEADMAVFDAQVMEITGGIAFEDLAPGWQESLAKRLDRAGIDTPSKPAIIKSYEEWKAAMDERGKPSDMATYIEFTLSSEADLEEAA